MLSFPFSFVNALAQLFWKVSHIYSDEKIRFLGMIFLGFVSYGLSTILVTFAFKHGKYNVLHPSLSAAYIFSSFFAYFILEESFYPHQVLAVFLIILGVVFIGASHDHPA